MSRLFIPPKRLDPLLKLAKLSEDSIDELFTVLANQPVQLYLPDAPNSIAKDLRSIPYQDGVTIVETLLSLYPAILASDSPVNIFIDDLVEAFTEEFGQKKDFQPDVALSLVNALQKLLRVPSLATGAKATNVLYQIERNLVTSRVISDIRPIFDLESDEINGALVIHTLKLEYFSDDTDNTKEFFVSLNAADIDQLIHNLTRAKRKAQRLREALQLASITYIDSEGT